MYVISSSLFPSIISRVPKTVQSQDFEKKTFWIRKRAFDCICIYIIYSQGHIPASTSGPQAIPTSLE